MTPHLIIPDIHNRVDPVEDLVAMFPDHHVVFLGDYFDAYDDTREDARRTAIWLRHSLQLPHRMHLMGNHDLPYRWGKTLCNCPGWSVDKHAAVAQVIKPSDWNRIKLVHTIDRPGKRPLLLSHAGVNLANLYGAGTSFDVSPSGRLSYLRQCSVSEHLHQLYESEANCIRRANHGHQHHWLNQGRRMGYREVAGPLWLDVDDHRPLIAGIDQIVGHSHVRSPLHVALPNTEDSVADLWYIDGAGNYAALVTETGDVVLIHARGDLIGAPI